MLTSIYVTWSAAQAPGVKIVSMNDKSLLLNITITQFRNGTCRE